MPFNFSSPEYLSHHRTQKNRVSPVSRASPAHMNSPLFDMLRLRLRYFGNLCQITDLNMKDRFCIERFRWVPRD